MNDSNLTLLGLSNKEAVLYETAIRLGKATLTQISRASTINRTTAYGLVKSLEQKGLLERDIGSKIEYITPKDPKVLLDKLDEESVALSKKREIISKTVDALKEQANKAKYQPSKIVYIEESRLEKYLYDASTKWNESIRKYDNHWWGFQDKTFVKHYEKWIDWYWEKSANANTQLKLLSNESAEKIKQKKFAHRQIKYWDKSGEFEATTWINGDYTIMIVTGQRPHYLIEIFDPFLAHDQRALYKALWETLEDKQHS